MPDQLTIRINVDGSNQTVSKFAVSENGHITIHNDAGASVNVAFAGASPLCTGNVPEPSVNIDAGRQRTYKVCDGTGGLEFKYTATVTGAGPEDPIFFIEKVGDGDDSEINPIFIIEMAPWILAGFIIGAFVGYFVAKRRTMSR